MGYNKKHNLNCGVMLEFILHIGKKVDADGGLRNTAIARRRGMKDLENVAKKVTHNCIHSQECYAICSTKNVRCC